MSYPGYSGPTSCDTDEPCIYRAPFRSWRQTVEAVFQMASFGDLEEFRDWDVLSFYEYVKSLQYVADGENERVSRPKWTIRELHPLAKRDCDDKSVIIGDFATMKRIPWRVAVIGAGPSAHHIYPEVAFRKGSKIIWVPVDATFPDRGGFWQKLYPETFRKVFYPPNFSKTYKFHIIKL